MVAKYRRRAELEYVLIRDRIGAPGKIEATADDPQFLAKAAEVTPRLRKYLADARSTIKKYVREITDLRTENMQLKQENRDLRRKLELAEHCLAHPEGRRAQPIQYRNIDAVMLDQHGWLDNKTQKVYRLNPKFMFLIEDEDA